MTYLHSQSDGLARMLNQITALLVGLPQSQSFDWRKGIALIVVADRRVKKKKKKAAGKEQVLSFAID